MTASTAPSSRNSPSRSNPGRETEDPKKTNEKDDKKNSGDDKNLEMMDEIMTMFIRDTFQRLMQETLDRQKENPMETKKSIEEILEGDGSES